MNLKETVKNSISKLIKPVLKLCLKNGIKYREITDQIKIILVEIAEEELYATGHEPTNSKLSVMTGLQRHEISRINSPDQSEKGINDSISRVIGLWSNSKKYQDENGKPKVLEFNGKESEFAKLIEKVSTDLNPYTVAFELERSGIIKNSAKGVKLLKYGYEPTKNHSEGLRLLAEDNSIFHSAVINNIFEENAPKNLHVKTLFNNIPQSKEEEVRTWLLKEGGKFHKRAEVYLSSLDRDTNESINEEFPEDSPITAVICSFSHIEIEGKEE